MRRAALNLKPGRSLMPPWTSEVRIRQSIPACLMPREPVGSTVTASIRRKRSAWLAFASAVSLAWTEAQTHVQRRPASAIR